MPPCNKVYPAHPWCKTLHTTKPVPQQIPVSLSLFSVILFLRQIRLHTVLHFLFLPVRIIAIYQCDHKINFRNVIVACHNNLHFCPANIFFICLINFTVIMIKQILQNENPIYLLNLYFFKKYWFFPVLRHFRFFC